MEKKGTPPSTNFRLLCSAISTLFILAGITALVLYLVYGPSRPHFTVLGAAIYRLTKSTSAVPAVAISTNMQLTVAIRNPNSRAAIQLDHLCAYVSYRDQPITPSSSLPSLYQEAEGTVVVSPVFGADIVPVSTEVETELMNDEGYGVVALRLVIIGRIKGLQGIIPLDLRDFGTVELVDCPRNFPLKKPRSNRLWIGRNLPWNVNGFDSPEISPPASFTIGFEWEKVKGDCGSTLTKSQDLRSFGGWMVFLVLLPSLFATMLYAVGSGMAMDGFGLLGFLLLAAISVYRKLSTHRFSLYAIFMAG
ncbi:hypothetical protein IEQ34_014788 [Dendrobium chrysotoxum]|uniref:Late embryogenesis abundant protein LEA-2 subgroup domain-containing protein n=1 Tax=Dendrobium chrysotoxum TaxID=161865 RepID=A0AAV7GK92_DENCH|nr:hypothetical protein IEQ34_014788 [Dendrobium chrysotoxum]